MQYFEYEEGEDYIQLLYVKEGVTLPEELVIPSHYNGKQVYLPNDCSCLFAECVNLKTVDLSNIVDTSNVDNMSCMFAMCTNLQEVSCANLDTTSVDDMSCMFIGCTALKVCDLSGCGLSNVRDVSNMFRGCAHFIMQHFDYVEYDDYIQIKAIKDKHNVPPSIDIPAYYKRKQVYLPDDCSGLFSQCCNLISLDLSDIIDTSNVSGTDKLLSTSTY